MSSQLLVRSLRRFGSLPLMADEGQSDGLGIQKAVSETHFGRFFPLSFVVQTDLPSGDELPVACPKPSSVWFSHIDG